MMLFVMVDFFRVVFCLDGIFMEAYGKVAFIQQTFFPDWILTRRLLFGWLVVQEAIFPVGFLPVGKNPVGFFSGWRLSDGLNL